MEILLQGQSLHLSKSELTNGYLETYTYTSIYSGVQIKKKGPAEIFLIYGISLRWSIG